MTAVIGGLFVAAGIIIFQWAFIEHRRPVLAAWLRKEFHAQILVFGMLLTIVFGISLFVIYFLDHGLAGLDVAEIGMLAVTAAVSAFAIVAMQRYWRRRKGEWAAAGASGPSSSQRGGGLGTA